MTTWQDLWHKQLFDLGQGHTISVNQLVLAAAVFLTGLFLASVLARILARNLARRSVSRGAVQTFQRAIFYTLLVTVALTTLRIMNIPLTMFAFLGGAIAIGVGFGAQNIINNFISGWILLAERQVRVGDLIEVQDHLGKVDSIGNRSTRVRRTDGIDMVVPNSMLLENTIINWTLTDKNVRAKLTVGVAYGSPTATVKKLIAQAVDEHPDVLKTPKPDVIFEDFGDNALIFDVYFWAQVRSAMELRLIQSAVRFRIDELFHQSSLVIAYPQQDTHLDTLKPLEIRIIDAINHHPLNQPTPQQPAPDKATPPRAAT